MCFKPQFNKTANKLKKHYIVLPKKKKKKKVMIQASTADNWWKFCRMIFNIDILEKLNWNSHLCVEKLPEISLKLMCAWKCLNNKFQTDIHVFRKRPFSAFPLKIQKVKKCIKFQNIFAVISTERFGLEKYLHIT